MHEPLHCRKIHSAYVIADVCATFQLVRSLRGHPCSIITHRLRCDDSSFRNATKYRKSFRCFGGLDKPEARQHVFSGRPMIIMENRMTRTVEKIEYDLERVRRERDALKTKRGGQSNYKMACMMVSALEKELSEAVSNQANDAHKSPDSV